jgi:hypothetical protein
VVYAWTAGCVSNSTASSPGVRFEPPDDESCHHDVRVCRRTTTVELSTLVAFKPVLPNP